MFLQYRSRRSLAPEILLLLPSEKLKNYTNPLLLHLVQERHVNASPSPLRSSISRVLTALSSTDPNTVSNFASSHFPCRLTLSTSDHGPSFPYHYINCHLSLPLNVVLSLYLSSCELIYLVCIHLHYFYCRKQSPSQCRPVSQMLRKIMPQAAIPLTAYEAMTCIMTSMTPTQPFADFALLGVFQFLLSSLRRSIFRPRTRSPTIFAQRLAIRLLCMIISQSDDIILWLTNSGVRFVAFCCLCLLCPTFS